MKKYAFIHLFFVAILFTSCKEDISLQPKNPEPELIIPDIYVSSLSSIQIEDNSLKILPDDGRELRIYDFSGTLLENRNLLENTNYISPIEGSLHSQLNRDSYIQVEYRSWDSVFYLNFYSTQLNELERITRASFYPLTDTISRYQLGVTVISNNLALPNEGQIGVLADFSFINTALHFYAAKDISQSFSPKLYYVVPKNRDLLLSMLAESYLYACMDKFIFWSNHSANGSFVKDYFLINQDGTYQKILERKNQYQVADFFASGDYIYCSFQDEDASEVYRATKTDLTNWEKISVSASFRFLGEVNNQIVARKDTTTGVYDDELNLVETLDFGSIAKNALKVLQADDEYIFILVEKGQYYPYDLYKLKLN